MLGLGLWMHFAPGSPLAQALPPTLRWPLIAIGGAVLAMTWVALVSSLLAHRRRR